MNLYLYHDPNDSPWDLAPYIPQDSLSLLQAEIEDSSGLLRATLVLELFEPEPITQAPSEIRALLRKPGILIIQSSGVYLFALYYDPIKTEYDPTTRRYRLNFVGLLEALRSYLSRDKWWNVLDASTLMASFKEFLSQYLPSDIVNETVYHSRSMSPIQEDPKDPAWTYFAGFIQPSSWLVGKQVDYSPNGPWTIINVLGVTKSLVQEETIFALCLAKPAPWWSTQGDYVLPIVVKATWNWDSWDWDVVDMVWKYDPDNEGNTWWWPVWFGLKRCPPGTTGDSALIYTVATSNGERVVCAWVESSVRKPGLEGDYIQIDDSWLRCVLLDGELNFLDQKRITLKYIDVGAASDARISAQTTILRGNGYNNSGTPAGVVFVGINGIVPFKCTGEGPTGYGDSGQDGLSGVFAVRWSGDAWTDNELQTIWRRYFVMSDPDTDHPIRLLDFEVIPFPNYQGVYLVHIIYGRRYAEAGNLALDNLVYMLYGYDAGTNTANFAKGDWWKLEYSLSEDVKLTPTFAVPVGFDYDNWKASFIIGYTILKYGEGGVEKEDIFFVDMITGTLRYTGPYWPPFNPWSAPYSASMNPDNAGIMELDIPITAGENERRDPREAPVTLWDDAECEQNLASQLRTLIACRMRPFAIRYEGSLEGTQRVKFHILHQSFSEWEAFAIAGEFDVGTGDADIYTLDGRDLRGELVPKIGGGQFNESDVWRSVVPYHSIWSNTGDIRSSGYDHQGNFGMFNYPIGVMSVPVVKKVCENDRIYSEPGKLGYQNMMNPSERYWWNVYNAHRLYLITTLSYWSFIEEEIDYRKETNLAWMNQSWDEEVHGLSYVAGRVLWKGNLRNRICLVLIPRWPLRGDNQTISGDNYWEDNKTALYPDVSYIKEKGFELGLQGRYWDALCLGPEGGALLTNIWWGDEGQFDRELVVKLESLQPQWFGTAYHRGGLYTDLFVFLRENEAELGGHNARVGMRELALPIYNWRGMIRIGMLINEDIMEDLEIRDDPELVRYGYYDSAGQFIPVPLYWQIAGLRWDLTRNTASFRLLETRDDRRTGPQS